MAHFSGDQGGGGGDPLVGLGLGVQVRESAYARYRRLGWTLLAEPIWGASLGVTGVGLSKDGLSIFVTEETPNQRRDLAKAVDGEFSLIVTGPIRASAGPGDSLGASRGARASGTFGCLVESANKAVFGLTCDHVVGDLAGQVPGDEVWAPGVAAGGSSLNRIGDFARGGGVTLSTSASNRTDAALVALDHPLRHRQSAGGAPLSGVNTSLAFGDAVSKAGATTGVTSGQFTYIVTLNIPYAAGVARFVDQLGIDGGAAPFSDSGDSGAVAYDVSGRVVGLVFASAAQSCLGFANPIGDVCAALGVSVK